MDKKMEMQQKIQSTQQKIQCERMDGGSISNELISKNSQNVTYWANPMPLETQWTLCDEVGILKGNILMDRKTLFEGVLDDDEVLDLMCERLTGDPCMTDMYYAIVDTTSDKVVVCVRGSIAERDTFSEELEIACKHIKTAVIAAGDDAISDFLGISTEGKSREELEQAMDAAMSEMSTLALIQHFKKYAAGDVTPEITDSVSGHFLVPERMGTPDIDVDFVPSAKRANNCPSLQRSVKYNLRQVVDGEYVATPIKNAFNDKTAYWMTKKDYTVAVYMFTVEDCIGVADFEARLTKDSLQEYEILFRNKFEDDGPAVCTS